MAVGAVLNLRVSDGLLAAFGGLFKGDGDVGLHITAPPGGIGVLTAPAAKAPAEEAVEDIGKIEARALEGVSSRRAAAEIGVHPRVAELIVARPLLLVGENLVGLVDLFELGLRILVPGVQVRVILFSQLPAFLISSSLAPLATPRTS